MIREVVANCRLSMIGRESCCARIIMASQRRLPDVYSTSTVAYLTAQGISRLKRASLNLLTCSVLIELNQSGAFPEPNVSQPFIFPIRDSILVNHINLSRCALRRWKVLCAGICVINRRSRSAFHLNSLHAEQPGHPLLELWRSAQVHLHQTSVSTLRRRIRVFFHTNLRLLRILCSSLLKFPFCSM